MRKLGNIGLGNFCKAVLEHKTIKIKGIKYFSKNYIAIYTYNEKYDIYVGDYSNFAVYKPEQLLARYIENIYNLTYTWEIM